MISHEYKCIFIHIQRTAGSSIENWICGDDWWQIEPSTKHLIASQAKKMYGNYWDEYYKFSFVREPVDRICSCLKYANHFGLKFDPNSGIDFSLYHFVFGNEIVVEHDQRYYKLPDLINDKHVTNSVYGNILDEELDYIGKFENLSTDLKEIGKHIGVKHPFNMHVEKSDKPILKEMISERDVAHIRNMYKKDFVRYKYESV